MYNKFVPKNNKIMYRKCNRTSFRSINKREMLISAHGALDKGI